MPYKDPNDPRKLAGVKAWGLANPEKVKAAKKKYAAKNKEAVQARVDAWKVANPEKMDLARKNWLKNNKGIHQAIVRKRQAGKINRTPAWLSEFDKLKIKCIYSIAAMLTRENKEPWHVDHIIPLRGKMVSGLHVPSNLWFIRGSENCKKSNKFKV